MPRAKEEVTKLIEALEEAGYEPTSYSGRGMYGKYCVSVSGDEVSAWNVAKALWFGTGDESDYGLDVSEPRQDSMGLGVVLYWPEYEWPNDAD